MEIKVLVVVIVLTIFTFNAKYSDSKATFSLASYYADHMVLQMEPNSAVIWGYAIEGSTISLTFKLKVYKTIAESVSYSKEAVWRIVLDPTPPSGPHTITVGAVSATTQYQEIVLNDVLFGDVWVCSGQSNMAFSVPDAFNATEILKDSYKYPNIRLLAVNQSQSSTPLHELSFYEQWTSPSPGALGVPAHSFLYFSAICYLYGVQLYNHFEYPIGLISDNWGGTPIQDWSSPQVIKACPSSANVFKKQHHLFGPQGDSVLWNAMIHPLLNFTIKGVIWDQGEANTGRPVEQYACLFPKMISDWRKQWFEGTGGNTDATFPFGFVQLCTSNEPFTDAAYPAMRWAQTVDVGYVPNPHMPNVFMAVAIDLPDSSSPYGAVHARDKQDVANRLALGARAVAYHENYTTFQGPFPEKICNRSMNTIIVKYNSEIKVKSKDIFEVCCSASASCQFSDQWVPVDVVNQVDLYSIKLGYNCSAVSVGLYSISIRYLWRDMPCKFKNCAVYGSASDLPAPTFNLKIDGACP